MRRTGNVRRPREAGDFLYCKIEDRERERAPKQGRKHLHLRSVLLQSRDVRGGTISLRNYRGNEKKRVYNFDSRFKCPEMSRRNTGEYNRADDQKHEDRYTIRCVRIDCNVSYNMASKTDTPVGNLIHTAVNVFGIRKIENILKLKNTD